MPSILPALRALLFVSALVPLLVTAGCGLKGDLVLPQPDDPPSPQQESGEDAVDEDSQDPDDASA